MGIVPESCLQYTSVFATMKLEMAVCAMVGLVIGYYIKD